MILEVLQGKLHFLKCIAIVLYLTDLRKLMLHHQETRRGSAVIVPYEISIPSTTLLTSQALESVGRILRCLWKIWTPRTWPV